MSDAQAPQGDPVLDQIEVCKAVAAEAVQRYCEMEAQALQLAAKMVALKEKLLQQVNELDTLYDIYTH